MRAMMRIGALVVALVFAGAILVAQEGDKKDKEKGEKTEKVDKGEKGEKAGEGDKGEKEEKPGKKKKLTKEEKEALKKQQALAAFGKKLFDGQSSQYSTIGKSCSNCHAMGGDKDLTGKVTQETETGARDAMKKCLDERMKADEAKKVMWEKKPNADALIAYLLTLKPKGK